jgi:murein L,D-transpeptidase YafK
MQFAVKDVQQETQYVTGPPMMIRRSFLGLAGLSLLSACFRRGEELIRLPRYDGPPITQIQIYKERRMMYLFSDQVVVGKYKVALGGNPIGPKRYEGDGRTPEGLYYIDYLNTRSSYHLSLRISYPNPQDVVNAQAIGKKPGGDIFIHGEANGNKGRNADWTAGCIAVTDEEIEEIFSKVPLGTPVFIYP